MFEKPTPNSPMTEQQAFDRAYHGVIAQGRLTKQIIGRAVYSYTPMCMCAIGHVIGYDHATRWEKAGLTTVDTVPQAYLCDAGLGDVPVPVLGAIQRAHDCAETLNDFLERMHSAAWRFNLEIPDTPTDIIA